MATNITFRSGLLGGVTDFCSDVALAIANAENVVELIVLLATYQEEGVVLKPKVYIFKNINQIISMLPDGEKLKIGITTQDINGIKIALKKCAPLSKGDWVIYLSESEDNSMEYGLFCGSGNPISVDLDDVILDGDKSTRAVRLYQLAGSCVELKSNSSETINVFLNNQRNNSPPPLKYFDSLIEIITENIEPEVYETSKNYLSKVLIEALEESHGCIVGVATNSIPPKFLMQDGTTFDKPIDFVKLISELQNKEIKESRLMNKGVLLKGMFNSDGIILFDRKGQLLGYNYFVNLPAEKGLLGGARKRAFSSLKKKVGNGLVAVFMQSQDGWTDFERKENNDN